MQGIKIKLNFCCLLIHFLFQNILKKTITYYCKENIDPNEIYLRETDLLFQYREINFFNKSKH